MYVNVTIQLQGSEDIAKTADQLAQDIGAAIPTDPEKDTVTVNVNQNATHGGSTPGAPVA